MWYETTSGMSASSKFQFPKAFYNKCPLVIKQMPVEAVLLAIYQRDCLAFLHVKNNPLLDIFGSLSTLSKSLVLTLGLCHLHFNGGIELIPV